MSLRKKILRKLVHYKKLLASYSDENTIFIYQMGKVGSTTLENSLPNAVHIHAFYSKNHTCRIRQYGLAKFGFKHFLYRVEQELLNFLLRWVFKGRKHTKIITLVRDPFVRNMAMFFHDLDAYLYAAHTNCMNTRAKPIPTRSQKPSVLFDIFTEEFDHEYAINWFDKEFFPMTGINIFQYAFDKQKGVTRIQDKNIDILCLSCEKMLDNEQAISDFTGCKVEIESANKAEDKWYGDLYKQFKVDYVLPKLISNKILNSRFYQHFFS